MPDVESLASRVQELAASLHRSKKWLIVALAFAVLSAAAAGVTAYLAFRQARQLAAAHGALAAAGEVKLSNELGSQRERAAQAEQRAAEAEQKADALRLQIAQSNERVAEVYRELSELTTPRILAPDERRTVSDKLKPFAGIRFDVALNPDTETQNLLLQLEDVLAASGWTQVDWVGSATNFTREKHRVAGVVDVLGIILQMHPNHVARLQPAADALVAALQVEGISATAQLGLGIKNGNPEALHILVGRKPK